MSYDDEYRRTMARMWGEDAPPAEPDRRQAENQDGEPAKFDARAETLRVLYK